MSNALVPMEQMQAMAKSLVSSKMFGFKTEAEAMSIMLIAQAEGRSPALAARDYHVIQGRPALKAEALLARFQQEGGVVEWEVYTDAKVSGWFSHPKSAPKPVLIEWTLDMAKRIGLANKDNWRNYPRAMLRSRVVGEGVRATYPGVAVGLYTVDEAIDDVQEKNITPQAGAVESLTEERRVQIYDLAEKVREWMNSGSLTDAYLEIENANLENEEYIFLWTHFDSKTRRQLKEEGERQKIKTKALENKEVISEAQKKRLEARIGELKLDREAVKKHCADTFGKQHFADLSRTEYEALDKHLDEKAAGSVGAGNEPPASSPPSGATSGPLTDADKLIAKARETAETGTAAYSAWFDKLNAAQQKTLGKKRHDELWEIAERFDRAAA